MSGFIPNARNDGMGIRFHNHEFLHEVVLNPYSNTGNAYIRIIREGIESQGYRVVALSDYLRFSGGLQKNIPIVLNWFEDINTKGRRHSLAYYKKRVILWLVKRKGGEIVYVVHNRFPHDGKDENSHRLSLKLRNYLCLHAAKIVILCDETTEVLREQIGLARFDAIADKIVKIPHPSYQGYYPSVQYDFRSRLGIPNSQFMVLFMGLVRKYKNIELILDVAREFDKASANATFVIAGECFDAAYYSKLQNKAGDNVVFLPGFVCDDMVESLVTSSDIMMLPYDVESSLNSGTCLLAFTYGRNVICPKIGTIRDLPPTLTYDYEYVSEDEVSHFEQLLNAARSAYRCWQDNRVAFNLKAKRLQSFVNDRYSALMISSQYAELIQSLDVERLNDTC